MVSIQEDLRQAAPAVAVQDTGRRGLAVKVLTRLEELTEIAAGWQRLWENDPALSIFQRIEWAQSWLEAFDRQHSLCTPVVFEDGDLIGIFPLVFDGRDLRFIGYSVSDYNNILSARGKAHLVVRAALEALARARIRWRRIQLVNVPDRSSLAQALAELPEPLRGLVVTQTPCPSVILSEKKEEILGAAREKLKRAAKAVERAGVVRFRHIEDRHELAGQFTEFCRQYTRRQILAGRPSKSMTPELRAFFGRLFERLDLNNEIRFSVLESGGRPIAYHLGFRSRDAYLWYKPSFDIDCWDLGPGKALMFHLFQYLSGDSALEFDFTQGDEEFKSRFANIVRQNLHVHIGRSKWAHRVEQARQAVRRAAAKIKTWRNPAVQSLWHWSHQFASDFSQLGLRRALIQQVLSPGLTRLFEFKHILVYEARPGRVEGCSVRQMRLSTLADEAIEHSVLDSNRLQKAREWIKRGYVPYLLETDSACAVVWTFDGTECRSPESVDLMFTAAKPGVWIVDSWLLRGKLTGPAFMSRACGSIAAAKNRPLYILCRNLTWRRAALRSGVRLQQRAKWVCLLGRTYRLPGWLAG